MGHVVVVGAGGNIGSHVAPHLARSPLVTRVTLIDPEHYEASNLAGQSIDARDVGRPKVVVQAQRMRRVNRNLSVAGLQTPVEDVPLGTLRCDVVLSCLDSRSARLVVNQAAWRLGVSWIDAGVNADQSLVRVQAFVPGANAACLECSWDQRDYDAVEQRYPCQHAAAGAAAPTRASSALGGLAAALLVNECEKLLAQREDLALVNRSVVLNAADHLHFVTAFTRRPSCRMPDHDGWQIAPLPRPASRLSLQDLLEAGQALPNADAGLALRIAGQRFVLNLTCAACGAVRPVFMLERELKRAPCACRACGKTLMPRGFELFDDAPLSSGLRPFLGHPLSRLGIRSSDVASLMTPTAEAHFELGAA